MQRMSQTKRKASGTFRCLRGKTCGRKSSDRGHQRGCGPCKGKQQRHEAPDMKLDEMLTLTTEHKQMNGVEQGLDDIKSSMKVLEADLKGIKVDKEV